MFGAIAGVAAIFALSRIGGRRAAPPPVDEHIEPTSSAATAVADLSETRARRARSRVRRLAGLAFNAALIVAAVFALFVAYGTIGNRWYRVITVTGGSMEPTIMRGDMIVVTPPPQRITPGMIVTMVVDGRVITHRVVSVSQDGSLVTKGDANESDDDWSGATVTVVGQYQFLIPQLGRLLPISNGTAALFNFRGSARQAIEIGTWATTPDIPAECAGMTFKNTVVGTDGDDVLNAGNGKSIVFGLGGNDTITGGNGKDCLVGGSGNDTITGANGPDVLLGGTGDDTLIGSNGPDLLDGGDGTDICVAGTGPATLISCESDTLSPVQPKPGDPQKPGSTDSPSPTPAAQPTATDAPSLTPAAAPTDSPVPVP